MNRGTPFYLGESYTGGDPACSWTSEPWTSSFVAYTQHFDACPLLLASPLSRCDTKRPRDRWMYHAGCVYLVGLNHHPLTKVRHTLTTLHTYLVRLWCLARGVRQESSPSCAGSSGAGDVSQRECRRDEWMDRLQLPSYAPCFLFPVNSTGRWWEPLPIVLVLYASGRDSPSFDAGVAMFGSSSACHLGSVPLGILATSSPGFGTSTSRSRRGR